MIYRKKTNIGEVTRNTWITSYFMVSEVIFWSMPKHYVGHFNKLLVKSMDFCEYLMILTEDLKIEEIRKDTKLIKSDIFSRICVLQPHQKWLGYLS